MTTRWIWVLWMGLFAVIVAAAQSTPASGSYQKTTDVQKAGTQEASSLPTPKDKRSYALGVDLGRQIRRNMVEIDPDVFNKGLKDALSGGNTLLSDEEVQAAIGELQAEMKRRTAEARKMGAEDNKKASEEFLAANKQKEGVVTLPSGLQYKILKAGNGARPTLEDKVVCNYRGSLVNGSEFDSSYARNHPMTFPVKELIKGWTEALQLMPVGSKWQLVIPPELAYGENGSGNAIGPNTTLIFEVELISIEGKS